MIKITHADLESVTKYLDEVSRLKGPVVTSIGELEKFGKGAIKLSKMIKDKYTEIKPDYDRTD